MEIGGTSFIGGSLCHQDSERYGKLTDAKSTSALHSNTSQSLPIPPCYLPVVTPFFAAAGSLNLLLAARTIYGNTNKNAPSASDSEGKTLDPVDCIQPENMTAIFDELYEFMQRVLAQLSQQIQQIQMTGRMMSEKQLREVLKAEFERNLLGKQHDVFEKHDVDE